VGDVRQNLRLRAGRARQLEGKVLEFQAPLAKPPAALPLVEQEGEQPGGGGRDHPAEHRGLIDLVLC
jgi:hypothetical protein